MERKIILAVMFALWLGAAGCNDSAVKTRTFSPEKDGTETPQASIGETPETTVASAGAEGQQTGREQLPGEQPAATEVGTQNVTPMQVAVVGNEGTESARNGGATTGIPPAGLVEVKVPAAPVVPSPILGRPPLVPAVESIAMLTTGEAIAESDSAFPEYTFPQPGSLRKDPEKREIKLLIPERRFTRTDPGQSLRVSYDDLDLLKVLNMEPVPPDAVDHFPKWLLDLDGKQIRLRGFMIPTTREKGLTGFKMARDNQICCFQRTPMVYDVFPVYLKAGATTSYIQNRPFDVVGTFHIRPDVYKGDVENLYVIDQAIVIDK